MNCSLEVLADRMTTFCTIYMAGYGDLDTTEIPRRALCINHLAVSSAVNWVTETNLLTYMSTSILKVEDG